MAILKKFINLCIIFVLSVVIVNQLNLIQSSFAVDDITSMSDKDLETMSEDDFLSSLEDELVLDSDVGKVSRELEEEKKQRLLKEIKEKMEALAKEKEEQRLAIEMKKNLLAHTHWKDFIYPEDVEYEILEENAIGELYDPHYESNIAAQRFNNGYRHMVYPAAEAFSENETLSWLGDRANNLGNFAKELIIGTPVSLINLVVKGDIEGFVGNLGRALINLGGLGMWDLADKAARSTDKLSILKRTDRGVNELLAQLGLPCGNFEVIPFVGPTVDREILAKIIEEVAYNSVTGSAGIAITVIRVASSTDRIAGDVYMSKHLYDNFDTDRRPDKTIEIENEKGETITVENKEKYTGEEKAVYIAVRQNTLFENTCVDKDDLGKTMFDLYRADPAKYTDPDYINFDDEDLSYLEDSELSAIKI